VAKAPKHAHDAVREDYQRIVYAETREAAQQAHAAFLLRWKKLCPTVAASLQEAGEQLLTFYQFSASQHLSLHMRNIIERMQQEFRRRIKTQAALPNDRGAARVLRVVGQRTDEAAPYQRLPRPQREKRSSCLKEKNFMTSQTKCAINFSTEFGALPTECEQDSQGTSGAVRCKRGSNLKVIRFIYNAVQSDVTLELASICACPTGTAVGYVGVFLASNQLNKWNCSHIVGSTDGPD